MNRFRLDLFRGNFDGADKNCVYDDKDKENYEDNYNNYCGMEYIV